MARPGTVLRASGVAHDIRRAEPYGAYPEFDFSVASQNEGDCWARAYVALHEMRESVKILRQAFKNIPPGPVRLKLGPAPRVPPGEVYARTEAAHGEMSYFIVSDGSPEALQAQARRPELQEHAGDAPPAQGGYTSQTSHQCTGD